MNAQTTGREVLTLLERVLLLASVPLFSETRTSDLAHLAAVVRESDLARGEVLHRAGDSADTMHVIVSGRIRFERQGRTPVELSEGAFGSFSLFDTEPRQWTATAVTPTRLLTIERDSFVDVMWDHVNVSRGVLRILAGRLRKKVGEQDQSDGLEAVEIG